MGFRAYNSKGVDKNGAKCNMGFGRITKIYLFRCMGGTCQSVAEDLQSTRSLNFKIDLQFFSSVIGFPMLVKS